MKIITRYFKSQGEKKSLGTTYQKYVLIRNCIYINILFEKLRRQDLHFSGSSISLSLSPSSADFSSHAFSDFLPTYPRNSVNKLNLTCPIRNQLLLLNRVGI